MCVINVFVPGISAMCQASQTARFEGDCRRPSFDGLGEKFCVCIALFHCAIGVWHGNYLGEKFFEMLFGTVAV